MTINGVSAQASVRIEEVASIECSSTSTGGGSICHVTLTMRAGRVVTIQCDDYDKALEVSRVIRAEQ